MDDQLLQQLRNLGATARLASGEEGVRVSLQYRARLAEPSRAARRELLHREFQSIAAELVPKGTEVDLGSLSISGQTVEAVLPLREYDHLVDDLKKRQVRVDALLDRQVVTG
jgi:hypothetical protein